MVWLNVGCGDHRAPPPWVNVDTQVSVGPDVVADIRRLPWPDGVVDRVYCGHVLEHLHVADVPAALAELRRVLAPGGLLCVVGPDYDRAAAADNPDEVLLRVIRDGGGRWAGDEHRWLSTEAATLIHVRSVFPDATPVPVDDVTGPWPVVSHVWWQFAIQARSAACQVR